ncbi:MAG: RNA methyltransferase [Actinobacteria bacterium]|nr:RNA methyltransferase [Actinomycetota bacterium]
MAPAGFGHRVEGLHAVAAAARAGRVERLFVERAKRSRPEFESIIAAAGTGVVTAVDDIEEIATIEGSQGLVADCRPLLPVGLDHLAGLSAALIVLDHLEDPHNVGAIARSALAAGSSGMVVSQRRAAPLTAVAFKAAAGALEDLPVAVVGSIPEALSRLRDLGVWTVGLAAGAAHSLFGLGLLTEPVAVVIGAEGSGLSRLAAERCDLLVSIPMGSGVESLNASVSAALASFEIMRARAAMVE